MYIASELIGVIAEMLLAHVYFKSFFTATDRPWWVTLSTYTASGIILTVFSFFPNASFLRLAFCAVTLTFIAGYLFEAKATQAIFASISFCGLYVLTEMIAFGLFSVLQIDVQRIMAYGYSRAISVILSHTLFWLLVLIVLAVSKRKRNAITLPFLLTLSPGYIAGILLGLLYCQQVLAGNDDMPFAFLIAAAGLLYLNILIILYAEKAQSAADQKIQMELAESHYAMQEQYYEQLRSDQEETRAMFHDINKYMQAMRALVADGNEPAAGQMIEETQKLFGSLETVVDVGNSVVSVILNEYKANAEEMSIRFDYDVSVPQNLGFTAVDLYVLLGNTLDNAIEACCSLPEDQRYIKLQLRTYHDILFYEVQNPFSADHPKRARGKNHGYGLKNVKRCVEKHNGHMNVSQDNGLFTLSLRLNNNIREENDNGAMRFF